VARSSQDLARDRLVRTVHCPNCGAPPAKGCDYGSSGFGGGYQFSHVGRYNAAAEAGLVPTLTTGETAATTTEVEYHHMSRDVCAQAGITFRQLEYWVMKGFVRPVTPTPGSGYVLEFDEAEAAVVVRLGALVRAGFLLRAAAELARSPIGDSDLGAGLRLEVSSCPG